MLVDFGVGYVRYGLCRCGICLMRDMSVWDKSGYRNISALNMYIQRGTFKPTMLEEGG